MFEGKSLSLVERIFVGVMSTLLTAGMTWTAITVTQILTEQSAQAEKVQAVLFRVSRIESRLEERLTAEQAGQVHGEISRVNNAQDNRLDDHEQRLRHLESR